MNRRFRVKVGGKILEVEVEEIQEEIGKRAEQVQAAATNTQRVVGVPPSARPQTAAPGRGVVRAPLPGKVLEIKCKEGEHVRAGDPILILESMKMENTILAPSSGVVKRIATSEGATVQFDETLIEIR